MWQIKLLKRFNEDFIIPDLKFYSNKELENLIRTLTRERNLDENIKFSREVMTILWNLIEKLGTQYLSLDLTGFALNESQHIKDYEKIFVELSERSYMTWSKTLGPEVQLLMLLIMHPALFIWQKNSSPRFKPETSSYKDSYKEMRGPNKI